MDIEKLRVQPFNISVQYANMLCTLRVEQTYVSTHEEVFTVIDGSANFQIVSDRPLIQSNRHNSNAPSYNAIDERMQHLSFFERIITEIQSHLKTLDNSFC